jgi:magnesium transporter
MSISENSLHRLRALLDEGDDASIREICEAAHPATLAEFLADVTPAEAARVLRLLPPEPCAEALGHFEPYLQRDAVELLTDDELAQAVTAMLSDDRVDLLKDLPEDRVESVLRRVAKAEREDILKLGSYEEGTAGAIMTSEYVVLTPELTVREALDKLRKEAPHKETIYYSYVVDKQRRLIGLVSLKDLILEKPTARIGDIMHVDLVVVPCHRQPGGSGAQAVAIRLDCVAGDQRQRRPGGNRDLRRRA